MNIDKITLNEIIPAEYNPRQISKEEEKALSENLKEYGLVDPIIINLKNNRIIGGHQRYHVLMKEGQKNKEFSLIKLGDIGWVFDQTDLKIKDEAYEKALNLSLNKIPGEWDRNKLALVLKDLSSASFNMELTGFDEIELATFNMDDNIFFNEDIFELEDVYTPPSKKEENTSMEQAQNQDQDEWNSETTNEEGDEFSSDSYASENMPYNTYSLEIRFESEEELDQAYKKLTEEGYNCIR